MIRLRFSHSDLARLRFAYSPLAEVAESLYVLQSGAIPAVHRRWFAMVRSRLDGVDMPALRAIVPAPRPHVASFLLTGARQPGTSIDTQLQMVAELPPERLRADLDVVWGGAMPARTRDIVEHGGGRYLADLLRRYWVVAIEPYWPRIRAVLDADIAYRATRLTRGGIDALLSDLHPELQLTEQAITVQSTAGADHQLSGTGLVLVPCVFAWPHVMADFSEHAPSITYAPRGVGDLWPVTEPSAPTDALAALLGRSRAAILAEVELPRSTSDLSRMLSQSAPAVSAHLAVLRNAGLVTSRRAGRRVLYQRTPLATSIITAADRRSDSAAAPILA